MSTSLPSGNYTIRSALDSGLFVGRDPRNVDRRIFTHPNGGIPPPIWQIQNAGEGRYYLRIDGFSTVTLDKFVSTTGIIPGEAWKVDPVPQHGRDQYIIAVSQGISGWVLPQNNPFTPVSVQPLIVQPSEPPRYPAQERWIVERSGPRRLGDLD